MCCETAFAKDFVEEFRVKYKPDPDKIPSAVYALFFCGDAFCDKYKPFNDKDNNRVNDMLRSVDALFKCGELVGGYGDVKRSLLQTADDEDCVSGGMTSTQAPAPETF
ncbi:hypothetical protein AAFF_G00087040 [Aldrovandia affinis]|uniref:Uncharacterized protein n=1 Tax=Aldrovandia affinis TaxID=143900 RepID=A0AAD7R1M4_9TELE|nr:hypothetical protein AAFF_G00087040 [Aldrovandia affinis]